jgi:hypothetical protein
VGMGERRGVEGKRGDEEGEMYVNVKDQCL